MEKKNLSSIREGGVILLGAKMGIVVSRTAADRTSGDTTVTWLDGSSQTFIWDESNPEVIYRGQGRLKVSIIEDTQ